jgi:hypothetical protein
VGRAEETLRVVRICDHHLSAPSLIEGGIKTVGAGLTTGDAHKGWIGAMRTSYNAVYANFGEYSFQKLSEKGSNGPMTYAPTHEKELPYRS